MNKFLIGGILLLALSGCAGAYPALYFEEMSPAERESFLTRQAAKCVNSDMPRDKISDCVNRAIAAHDKEALVVKKDRGEALKENVEDKIEVRNIIMKEYRHISEKKVSCSLRGKANQTIICR